jgi:chemotaxis protein MotB
VIVKSTSRGINIRIKEEALFSSGSVKLQPQVREFLDLVAALVSDLPNFISVEGHTDSLPIHTGEYLSNWELSASRATTLVRYFTELHDLDPKRFSATGFAGFRPINSNETASGKAENRRVEIIILRTTHVPPVERHPFLN